MSDPQTTPPEEVIAGRWPKVDWKAGDKITIELKHDQAIALNYQHSWLVSLSNAKVVSYEVCP